MSSEAVLMVEKIKAEVQGMNRHTEVAPKLTNTQLMEPEAIRGPSSSSRPTREWSSVPRSGPHWRKALDAAALGIQGMRATSSAVSVEKTENENEHIIETLLLNGEQIQYATSNGVGADWERARRDLAKQSDKKSCKKDWSRQSWASNWEHNAAGALHVEIPWRDAPGTTGDFDARKMSDDNPGFRIQALVRTLQPWCVGSIARRCNNEEKRNGDTQVLVLRLEDMLDVLQS